MYFHHMHANVVDQLLTQSNQCILRCNYNVMNVCHVAFILIISSSRWPSHLDSPLDVSLPLDCHTCHLYAFICPLSHLHCPFVLYFHVFTVDYLFISYNNNHNNNNNNNNNNKGCHITPWWCRYHHVAITVWLTTLIKHMCIAIADDWCHHPVSNAHVMIYDILSSLYYIYIHVY